MTNISNKNLKLLNSKLGIKTLLTQKTWDYNRAIKILKYENELVTLQAELLKLQTWIQENKTRVIILFEGRDSAGKGGAIRRITHYLNPRSIRITALPKPTMEEKEQWYFQRYINHFPKSGEMLFFDRSWYNRAVVEPVNGFCTQKEYEKFMDEVNDFERMLVSDNSVLIKLYFSITKEEQKSRFENIQNDPLKRWKYSEVDSRAQALWDVYTEYKKKMFEKTNTEVAPWKVIEANSKGKARIEAIKYILDSIPYNKGE